MPVEPNINRLGDKLLSPKEALKKAYEETDKRLNKYRLYDHEELKQTAARMGKPLTHNVFIARVLKMNPNLIYEDSINYPGHGAFYLVTNNIKKYLGAAFQKGFLPEFDIIQVDAADLATGKTVGWRSVLWRLIKQKAITKNQCDAAFGKAGVNDVNVRWNRFTRNWS